MAANRSAVDPTRSIKLELGLDVRLPMDSVVQCPLLSIGNHTRINGAVNVRGSEPCMIGKYCALGYGIHILTTDHKVTYPNIQLAFQRRYGFASLVRSRGPVNIGHNVWLGDGVTVLPGATIGNGAVVGAGAVVTKDIPPFSVFHGVPARFSEYRFAESVIEQLETIEWWHWEEDKITRNSAFFNTDLAAFTGQLHEIIV